MDGDDAGREKGRELSFIELLILKKIQRNQEKIMATFQEVKAQLDGLVAAVEGLIAKMAGGQIVSVADMDAAIQEMKDEVAKITAVP